MVWCGGEANNNDGDGGTFSKSLKAVVRAFSKLAMP